MFKNNVYIIFGIFIKCFWFFFFQWKIGVGVMMLLALTIERYVSVCRPGKYTRPLCGPPHLTVSLIPLATFLVYLPSAFRGEITTCLVTPGGSLIYQKRDNLSFMHSVFYQVRYLSSIYEMKKIKMNN